MWAARCSLKRVSKIPYLRFIIGLALILLIGTVVDFDKIGQIVSQVKPGYVLVVLGCITLDRMTMGIKWQVLLRAKGVRIPTSDVIKTYYIGNFLGFFLPPTVGVDIARALHMTKYERDMPKILSSIVIERMVGFLALTMFSLFAVGIAITNTSVDLSTIILLNIVIVLAGAVVIALSVYRPLHRWLFLELCSRFPQLKTNKLIGKLKEAYHAFQEYKETRRSLWLFIVLTMVETSIPLFTNYFVGRALGLDIVFAYFAMIIPITMFIQRIPVLPTMIGVREGMFVVLFGLANITAAQAFTLSALWHFLTFVAVTPGLLFYFLHPLKRSKQTDPVVAAETTEARGSI
jgi:uncharacterized protein (TIRG00374 family)